MFCFLLRLATKVGIAGGAVYVAYDSGLLSGSADGAEALSKAKAVIPPAVEEWSKYFGLEVKYIGHINELHSNLMCRTRRWQRILLYSS